MGRPRSEPLSMRSNVEIDQGLQTYLKGLQWRWRVLCLLLRSTKWLWRGLANLPISAGGMCTLKMLWHCKEAGLPAATVQTVSSAKFQPNFLSLLPQFWIQYKFTGYNEIGATLPVAYASIGWHCQKQGPTRTPFAFRYLCGIPLKKKKRKLWAYIAEHLFFMPHTSSSPPLNTDKN